MSQELVQDATDKVRGAVPAQKALMMLENVLIEPINASLNLKIQKRVTQALLVKGLPKKRMEDFFPCNRKVGFTLVDMHG